MGAVSPEFSMRGPAQRLLEDVRKAQPAQIDQHVERFMREKAQRHARMIARSETIESYRDGYRKSTRDKEWVKGYQWKLGSRHPKPDECDILAGQNLYGLGPGGYPVDKVPETPHPNDMCVQVAIIDKDHFKRQKAQRNNAKLPPETWKRGRKQTSAQWLRKQSKRTQEAILGPTKLKAFKSGGSVLDAHGVPKRVKDI